MNRDFLVYTKVEQERVYSVPAESAEDAKAKLQHALENDYYDNPYIMHISDYGTEELTGEVGGTGS